MIRNPPPYVILDVTEQDAHRGYRETIAGEANLTGINLFVQLGNVTFVSILVHELFHGNGFCSAILKVFFILKKMKKIGEFNQGREDGSMREKGQSKKVR